MRRVALAAVVVALAQSAVALDVDALWNYNDPAASEVRFRSALAGARGDDALVLRTQIARTLGLRERFDEAHRELDAIDSALPSAGAEPRVRAALERGRALRSSGKPQEARPFFQQAFDAANAAGIESLAADALHMLALTEPALDARIAWNRKTIAYAERAKDPRARGWRAPALNNIGSDLRDAGRLAESLGTFEQALVAYREWAAPTTSASRAGRWPTCCACSAERMRRWRCSSRSSASRLRPASRMPKCSMSWPCSIRRVPRSGAARPTKSALRSGPEPALKSRR